MQLEQKTITENHPQLLTVWSGLFSGGEIVWYYLNCCVIASIRQMTTEYFSLS